MAEAGGGFRFNSFVREKLRTSLRVVALTTLREVEGKDMEIEDVSLRSGRVGQREGYWDLAVGQK